MRKFNLLFLALIFSIAISGCGAKKDSGKGNLDFSESPTPGITESPTPSEQPKDYSLSTTLPDGTQRIEGTYISDKDESTIIVETVGGNKEIVLNSKVKEHIKLLKIEHGNIIVLTVKDKVADSIEKVVS